MNYTFADLKKYCAEKGLKIATMPGTDQLHFYEFGEIPNIEKTIAKQADADKLNAKEDSNYQGITLYFIFYN